MNTDTKIIPDFTSYQEEADWWDAHDPLDYRDPEAPIVVVKPKKANKEDMLVIRMDENLKRQLLEDAQQKGIGISTQGRIILNEYYNRK